MIEHLLIGASFAFAAAVQPGPLQAYFFSRVAAIGWKRTLPAAASPLLSDGPIALVALVAIGQLSTVWQSCLRAGGGVLLLYLASRAFAQWRRDGGAQAAEQTASQPPTLLAAAFVNLLNPNPYLGWTLILGPSVVTAWKVSPHRGVAVVVAFYVTIIAVNAMLIVGFGTTRFLGPRARRFLLLASALVLAGLAAYQLVLAAELTFFTDHPPRCSIKAIPS